MMPAAFSNLFDGSPDNFAQRICRDMKLMDAVFEMGTAPYIRCFTNSGPGKPWKQQDLAGGPRVSD